MQAETVSTTALRQLQKVQIQVDRYVGKAESLQDLRRQVNSLQSLGLVREEESKRVVRECDRLKQRQDVLLKEIAAHEARSVGQWSVG